MSDYLKAGEDIHKGDPLFVHWPTACFYVYRTFGNIQCQATRDIKKGEKMTSADTELYRPKFVPYDSSEAT